MSHIYYTSRLIRTKDEDKIHIIDNHYIKCELRRIMMHNIRLRVN